MLKPLLPEFERLDLPVCSKDIAEKWVPAKLKPIVGHLQRRSHVATKAATSLPAYSQAVGSSYLLSS